MITQLKLLGSGFLNKGQFTTLGDNYVACKNSCIISYMALEECHLYGQGLVKFRQLK